MISIPDTTKEYLYGGPVQSATGVDLSALPVSMALVPVERDPVAGDWKAAAWQLIAGELWCRVLVGDAATIPLIVGDHYLWGRITSDPEIPVMRFDRVAVYARD